MTLRLAYVPAYNLKERQFRFELKCVDGTANPYLALAAIITAGVSGIRNNLPLHIKGIEGKQKHLSETKRKT